MNDLIVAQLEIRKNLAKNPEAMSGLVPVEKAVYLAATGRPIDAYNSVELAKELRESLHWICKDVGFRSSNEADAQYLVVRTSEILKRYYADLSLRDFRMAFEMCLTGELDEYLPRNKDGQPERNHYQNFNAEYICRILNAYRARRRQIIGKVKKAADPEKPSQDFTQEQKKRLAEKARNMLLASYGKFVETGNLEASPIQEIIFYSILSDSGLAEPIEVTDEERKAVFGKILMQMTMKGASAGEIHRFKERGIGASDVEQGAFQSARRKALEKTFADLKKQEIKLEDYVRIED